MMKKIGFVLSFSVWSYC